MVGDEWRFIGKISGRSGRAANDTDWMAPGIVPPSGEDQEFAGAPNTW
jgi:hypothetical protein